MAIRTTAITSARFTVFLGTVIPGSATPMRKPTLAAMTTDMATALVRVTQAVTPAAIPATVTHIRLTDYANCALTWRQAMPFDGIEFALDDRLSKMDQVISLLDAPNKWCKGVLKTYDGKYCLRGAIMAVDDGLSLQPVVLRAI